MRISVVIPAYNAAKYLCRALDSVMVQEVAPAEVIVVDDGSTDSTAEIARAHPLRPRLIRLRNSGVSTARNRGMEAATGDYIALLDADDEWRPGHLAALRDAVAQHPDAVLLWAGITHRFADGAAAEAGTLPDSNAKARAYAEPGDGARVIGAGAYEQMLYGNFISPSACLFKRDRPLAFDAGLKLGEDLVFFLELMARGKAVFVDAEHVIIHRDGSNASVTIDRAKHPLLVERQIQALQCIQRLPAVEGNPNRAAIMRRRLAKAYRDQVYYASFLGVRKTLKAMRTGWTARQIGVMLDAVFVAKNLLRAARNSSVLRRPTP